MMMSNLRLGLLAAGIFGAALLLASLATVPQDPASAQPPQPPQPPMVQPPFPPFGPGGPSGPGGFMGQTRAVVKDHDKDGDGRLNLAERNAAREALKNQRAGGRGPGGFGPPGAFGRGGQEPAKPGPTVKPEDVKAYPDAGLYEPTVLRT